ncbi:MAG: HNH endonuclease [Mucilaginibacter sp.]|jgi:putative restriction endonuclease|uniref:HNH endonuclease n=1 Tax=Mucilaginibacter sp. TaxID=1882438 RepID=UPI003567C74F
MSDPSKFLYALTHLNRAPTKFGKAPHKPVLLLTLLELMESGYASENRFYPDTELVGVFQENWRLLVDSANHPDFTQPFYYLQSEKIDGQGYWALIAMPGCQVNAHIKSINKLISVVNYGRFSDELFLFLSDAAKRAQVRRLLIETYFPSKAGEFVTHKRKGEGYFHDLEAYILNAPEARKKIIKIETEEEVYVRSGLFKRLVPQVYAQTCAISGMQLGSTFGHTFVDACHIVPFSVSHDDRVTNGLALCPNIHRAFDRGLIAIGDDYSVLLSSHIREKSEHAYSLTRFEGERMLLPEHKSAWPDVELLRWHRREVFRG